MTLGDFVRERKYLFWSTRNYDGLSNSAVVEGILNYGDMNDVRELIALLGMKKVTLRVGLSSFWRGCGWLEKKRLTRHEK